MIDNNISIILVIFTYICVTPHGLWSIFTNIVAALTVSEYQRGGGAAGGGGVGWG